MLHFTYGDLKDLNRGFIRSKEHSEKAFSDPPRKALSRPLNLITFPARLPRLSSFLLAKHKKKKKIMKTSSTSLLLLFFFIPAILTAPIPQNLHPYDEDVDGKPAYYNVIAEANRAGLNPGFGIPSKPKEYEKPEEIPKWDPGNAGVDEYNAAIKAAMKEQGFDFDSPSYRS